MLKRIIYLSIVLRKRRNSVVDEQSKGEAVQDQKPWEERDIGCHWNNSDEIKLLPRRGITKGFYRGDEYEITASEKFRIL